MTDLVDVAALAAKINDNERKRQIAAAKDKRTIEAAQLPRLELVLKALQTKSLPDATKVVEEHIGHITDGRANQLSNFFNQAKASVQLLESEVARIAAQIASEDAASAGAGEAQPEG